MAKVYVTDSAFPALDIEKRALTDAGHEFAFLDTRDPAEIVRRGRDADALLVQFAPISRDVLDGLPRLKAMVRYGVGYDNFDVDAARKKGVIACNCPGYCLDEVAEHTVAMILAAARRLVQIGQDIRDGNWRIPVEARPVMSLKGKVLGLVGFGGIAKQVAMRVLPFGMRVLALDPLLTPERAAENGAEAALLDDLLARADFLSLHCPLTSSTRHIIDAAALAKAKPGVILINNGRGGLVDEDALADALESGHVAYAALDVLEVEPPAPGNRLIGMPNVLVTPHMASVSETSVGRLQQMAVDEVIRILDGKPALAPLWR